MTDKEQIVVLHTIKHSDSGVVVQCYSRERGREALYLRVSQKNKVKISNFHRLSILDIITYSKNSYMPVIREYASAYKLDSIRSDVYKSTVAIFLSELLLKSVREAEGERSLYDFLVSSVNMLENMEEGIANFHLHFMVRLCKFMGIMPVNDYSGPESIFSLPAAKFADTLKNEKPLSPFLSRQESELLYRLMVTPVSMIGRIECNGELRSKFAKEILKYISYHLGTDIELKSLDVLHEVFN